jgi:hypothetical protein
LQNFEASGVALPSRNSQSVSACADILLTTTIGQHLRYQYELAAPAPPHLAALVEKLKNAEIGENLWVL